MSAHYQVMRRHFNPLPPHGGRPDTLPYIIDIKNISIHSLRMEGDRCRRFQPGFRKYFNPLPPHGGRLSLILREYNWFAFQSTPSAWRETNCTFRHGKCFSYFNPLPPHGGRLQADIFKEGAGHISIHSLRMEGDSTSGYVNDGIYDISIHSLRMEGDSVHFHK